MDEISFKICLFGDGGVGKTTLTMRYLTGLFKSDTKLTIGTNFYKKSFSFNENTTVSLLIWDFGGEKQFRNLFSKYVAGSNGAIFMYDVTRFSSLMNVDNWMKTLKEGLKENYPIPILMVGSKIDLKEQNKIEMNYPAQVVNKFNFFDHILCSAKTGYNVDLIFKKLAEEIMKKLGFV